MKLYQTNGGMAVTIHTGVVILTAEQYKGREQNLRVIETGPHGEVKAEVLKAIQFKRGEAFVYDGELHKALASELQPLEEVKAAVPVIEAPEIEAVAEVAPADAVEAVAEVAPVKTPGKRGRR